MKDIFKFILALPFLGFQAGGSIVLGCLGAIFYLWCILCAISGIIFIIYNVVNAIHGNVDSMKLIGFFIISGIIAWIAGDIYGRIKYRNL